MKTWGILGILGVGLILIVAVLYLVPNLRMEYPGLYKYSWKALIIWGIIFAGYYLMFLLKNKYNVVDK